MESTSALATSRAVALSGIGRGRQRFLVLLALGAAVLSFAILPFDRAVIDAVTACVLVVLAAVDLERRVVPNQIVLPAAVFVLALNSLLFPDRAAEWVLAAGIAGTVFALPALLGLNWFGMGDAKLLLLLGAALGWATVGAVTLAFLLTLPVSGVLFARAGATARKATIPFAPFLAAGALIVMFVPTLVGVS